jgi:hypothetical protein
MKRLVALVGFAACTPQPKPPIFHAVTAPVAPPVIGKIALPGATADGVGMDYLLYDPRTNSVWVPAGNTGAVDVVDAATGQVRQITGFATQEMERRGAKRLVGPSSATLGGGGTVYIGNRGDSSVCAVDEVKLAVGACGKLDAMPDGIAYVASTNEVWVTTPRDKSLRILDGATLVQKARIELPEGPEGFAVDDGARGAVGSAAAWRRGSNDGQRGRFYTNFEDGDATIAIDVATHATVATWKDGCGSDGPRGLRLATPEGLLFVACHAAVRALAVDHDGAIAGSVPAAEGLDDIDYAPATHLLYAGGASGGLTVATVAATGVLTAVATYPTSEGARNGVVDRAGKVYLSHGKAGELLTVDTAPQVKAP